MGLTCPLLLARPTAPLVTTKCSKTHTIIRYLRPRRFRDFTKGGYAVRSNRTFPFLSLLFLSCLSTLAFPAFDAASAAPTPPMGWNSWNHFGHRVTDQTIRDTADAMVASGMRDAGYVYVNIDDTWEGTRDAEGHIHPNEKFPDMKALADYVHSKGLKLGIYSSPGAKTCAGFEGSLGHEEMEQLQPLLHPEEINSTSVWPLIHMIRAVCSTHLFFVSFD